MLKTLNRILGGSAEGPLKKLRPEVDEINELEPKFQALSNEQLRALTDELKGRLADGDDLDDLLPESFAAVREAGKRTLGQRHFDVQLMGGIVLHQGKIAEMRTGEGKTLVATLPTYLNALTGDGVHVVTVNDYLARRDAQWMGSVYNALGLTVGILQHDAGFIYDSDGEGEPGFEHLRQGTRREAYAADITYGTNNEFGFDYLRDNMVIDKGQRVQRSLAYGIVDEVDNILIDEARTPLIISGPAEESGKEYHQFARVVPGLQQGPDFTIDEKHRTVSLTGDGMSKMEQALKVDNLYDPANSRLVHFVENALKAQAVFERDKEYVVNDGEVVIVDEFTGRLMPGRRYSDGLHQALEAKEGLQVQRETITYGTITLQNYFRLYSKLAGMTGTAATEAEEFWKIYKLDVMEIPTNLTMVREDRPDLIYRDQKAKYKAVVENIEDCHRRGQPVLVGTTDISKSEILSESLKRNGIPHEVLNAKQHEREAGIIAEAGRPGAVTVATNMAGRGTDIVLGGNPEALGMGDKQWESDHQKVLDVGGLHIIGTERHEARRIDNQLRGRAGRQGDPGDSRFYVALDDDLMRRFGGDRIQTIMGWAGLDENTPLENKMVSKSIEGAQIKVEAFHFDVRKHLVDYDDVVNTHRSVIYVEREKVLGGSDLKANVQEMVERELQEILGNYLEKTAPEDWDVESLIGELQAVFELLADLADPDSMFQLDREEIKERVLAHAREIYDQQEETFTPEVMRSIEGQVMLRVIDSNWVRHLTSMENLRQGIGLYAFGQRDPLVMYKKEGRELFDNLLTRIQYDIVHAIFHVGIVGAQQNGQAKGPRKGGANAQQRPMTKVLTGSRQQQPVDAGTRKVGRNEPCPCGSGKKYKRCHGA